MFNSPQTQPSFQSKLGGDFHIHQSHLTGKSQGVVSGITHKSRTFGQSHWINGTTLVRDIIDICEPHVQEDAHKILTKMKRCKNLARIIKARRAPPWPQQSLLEIPTKDIADALIDCYLQTIESVYRILHIPSFRRDYATIWSSTEQPNPIFLIQLKLVLAIGAAMHDNTFSLRTSAIQWVYEAQTRISEPKFKSMLGIQYLQIHLLLLIAREAVDVSCEMVWISVGSLYRMAIQMGLHRDPALLPKSTTFVAEMRRRLWNTILEISMQSSLTSGGPPLTSIEDFDTLPPGNFDDEQLLEEQPVTRHDDQFTGMSFAIALRKTLPYRLAVVKALNNLGTHNTYETTLRLDTELRQSYRTVRETIRMCLSNDRSSEPLYAMRLADIIMHRYLSALHTPYFAPAFHETAFAFSRKVVIESSLKTWYAVFPSSYNTAGMSGIDAAISIKQDYLSRLMTCGSGFFRVVVHQAAFSLAIELRNQLREDEGMGSVSARPDLLAVLEGAKEWSLCSIKAGETSVKGYVMFSGISAQVDGLLRGNNGDKDPETLIKAAVHAEETCLPILEAAADALVPRANNNNNNETEPTRSNSPTEATESWDIMVSHVEAIRAADVDLDSRCPIPCLMVPV